MTKKLTFAGYTFWAGPKGTVVERQAIDSGKPDDYGADPLPDGTFRMVPSGDVVSLEERNARLAKR